MTPEEARKIDRLEFEAQSEASTNRALKRLAERREAEKERLQRWLGADATSSHPIPKNHRHARSPALHTLNGESRTLTGWALHLGISPAALRLRIVAHGSLEAAVNKGGRRRRRGTLHTVGNATYTIQGWASVLGISPNAMHQRIFRLGSVEAAVAFGPCIPRRGVASDFDASLGTGGGSTAQHFSQLEISK